MTDYRKGWIALALNDQAFFYVALSHSAGDVDLTLRKGDPDEAVSYRIRAIRIINERLGNPQRCISDGTISAVAAIANYEVSARSSFISSPETWTLKFTVMTRNS
jgi:hypothetical protein